MATIFHQLIIRADAPIIYKALSTQEGLSMWWIRECTAKAEIGFINTFRMDEFFTNKMKVTDLITDEKVNWLCIESVDAWIGTKLSFELVDNDGRSYKVNFKQEGYSREDEFYASCNYQWARHLAMLKYYCESGETLLNAANELDEIKTTYNKNQS